MRDYDFGNFLRELRMRRGLSQFQLGSLVGVTEKAVSKWERDLSCPDVDSLPRLAEIFGITVDEMLNARENPAPQPKENKVEKIMDIVLKAVPLAMGVAVTVSALMKTLDIYSGFSMLGIGLACIGVKGLENKE